MDRIVGLFFLLFLASDLQGQNNYQYDEQGRLVSDLAEGIAEIKWNNRNKIIEIVRVNTSNDPDVLFFYNAQGNRIAKLLKPRNAGELQPEHTWYYIYYVHDDFGNILSTYARNYTQNTQTTYTERFNVFEQYLYGSECEGYKEPYVEQDLVLQDFSAVLDLNGRFTDITDVDQTFIEPDLFAIQHRGLKKHHIKNAQRNILGVVNDRRKQQILGQGTVEFVPEIISAVDYYPYGMAISDREYSPESHRFGYAGMEKDDEIKGDGNSYNFGARMYDTRVGRWLSSDPLQKKYPAYSPYSYALNSPLALLDRDGRQIYDLEGNRVRITQNENGMFYINNPYNVPSGTLILINLLNQSEVGRETLAELESSNAVMKIGLSDKFEKNLLGVETGHTIKGYTLWEKGVIRSKKAEMQIFPKTWDYYYNSGKEYDDVEDESLGSIIMKSDAHFFLNVLEPGDMMYYITLNGYIYESMQDERGLSPFELYLEDFISYVSNYDFETFLTLTALHEADHLLNAADIRAKGGSKAEVEASAKRREFRWLKENESEIYQRARQIFSVYDLYDREMYPDPAIEIFHPANWLPQTW